MVSQYDFTSKTSDLSWFSPAKLVIWLTWFIYVCRHTHTRTLRTSNVFRMCRGTHFEPHKNQEGDDLSGSLRTSKDTSLRTSKILTPKLTFSKGNSFAFCSLESWLKWLKICCVAYILFYAHQSLNTWCILVQNIHSPPCFPSLLTLSTKTQNIIM